MIIELIITTFKIFLNMGITLWKVSPFSFLLLSILGIFGSFDSFIFNHKYLKKYFEFLDNLNKEKTK